MDLLGKLSVDLADETVNSMHPNTYIREASLKHMGYEFKDEVRRNTRSESSCLGTNKDISPGDVSVGECPSSFVPLANWVAFIADYGAFNAYVLSTFQIDVSKIEGS
ncbi:hypothetical protein Fot_22510 [Forsythia ovata]|uniref:Uncharacterized protein n=1 Tax=Forsythia ovata TaxID=205694 RepID=A0ABD1UXX8_9LAMI